MLTVLAGTAESREILGYERAISLYAADLDRNW